MNQNKVQILIYFLYSTIQATDNIKQNMVG